MVTRVFDLLELYKYKRPLMVALAGKQHGKWRYYSGLDYVKYSNAFSYALLSMNVGRGDIVATVSGSRPEWNIVDMGVLQTGAVHCPLATTLSSEDYRYIFNLIQPKVVVTSTRLLYELLKPILESLTSAPTVITFADVEGTVSMDETIARGESEENRYKGRLDEIKASICQDDLCTLIFTSGTTGTPKGVMHSHHNLISNFTGVAKVHDFGYGDKTLSFLPLSHAYERMINLHFQYKGTSIYYAEGINTLLDNFREVKAEISTMVPRVLEKIYDGIIRKGKTLGGFSRSIFQWSVDYALNYNSSNRNPMYRLKRWVADQMVYTQWLKALGGNLKIVVSGGAPLQPRLANFFEAMGIIVVEGYGLTETSPVIAVNAPKFKQVKHGTVGPVLEGVTVKFAEDGEILCKGPNIMLGYYKSPELTAQVIDEDGWFHTGDIGCLDEGLYLKITDRKKEIFKLSNGKYVAPARVELLLAQLPVVENAIVVGEDQKYASAIISVNHSWLKEWASENGMQAMSPKELVLSDQLNKQVRSMLASVNEQLASYERVKRVRLVTDTWTQQNGFLSAALKLKRSVILNHYRELVKDIYKTQGE